MPIPGDREPGRAGLFEDPYVDPAKAEAAQLLPDAVAAARRAAGRSLVLLKNDDDVLPLDPSKKTAVIGPLGDDQHNMLGPWWGRGRDEGDYAVSGVDAIGADSVNVGTGTVSPYYLSLDQGMIMAALGNALAGDVLRKAFATSDVARALRPVMRIEQFGATPDSPRGG
jgi:beta-glucosidase-like glycosyl hydrolase